MMKMPSKKPPAAKLAAQHASDIEVAMLEDLCCQYVSSVGNEEKLLQNNRQFH